MSSVFKTLGFATSWLLLLPAIVSTLAAAPAPAKLFLVEPGVYRVGFEQLASAGWTEPVDTSTLGLSWRGASVPIRVEDGGDSRFGVGDWFEFVAEVLPGEVSYHNEHTFLNVYFLDARHRNPMRMSPGTTGSGAPCPTDRYAAERHFERDRLRVRFPSESDVPQDVWFWDKLTQIDEEPYRVELQMPQLDRDAPEQVRLRVNLRGWSRLPHALSRHDDHSIEAQINGRIVGAATWDNRPEGQTLELALPASEMRQGSNSLELRVPPRKLEGSEQAQVDAILLNWVELSYPRTSRVERGQIAFAAPLQPTRCLAAQGASSARLGYFAADGAWYAMAESGRPIATPLPVRGHWVVTDDQYLTPLAVVPDTPSNLRGNADPIDYIIVAHPKLLDAVRPLARFHRERGLEVLLVDVTDVYDEFSHGLTHPRAIRDFLAHAHAEWKAPAPRFVLLVGDASWDPKNVTADDRNYVDWTYRDQQGTNFVKNDSTPYETLAELNYRNLIPTWSWATREGHAASDNGFVDLTGDDGHPEMAIGRFPVTEVDEVAAIVKKTIRYASSPALGEWRRRVLWITNEESGFQFRSDQLALGMEEQGFESVKVYPVPDEPSNETHRETLRRAFDDGQWLVHFFGHGGRYIWRTGPPDLRKNHDLFTLDDLDALESNARLPIVLSMTCYSAPFDHPNADSIGEKFLRMPDRGSVAVIAASWRNSPTQSMSQHLIDGLMQQPTLGEAFLYAKNESTHKAFLHMYNLLGDPALPLVRPALRPSLELVADDPFRLRGTVDVADLAGVARVEWLDEEGRVMLSRELPFAGSRFDFELKDSARPAGEPSLVRLWVESESGDGFTAVALDRAGDRKRRISAQAVATPGG